MIFKGRKYRISRRVVVLPQEFEDEQNYVAFGRACPKNTPGAIKTAHAWKNFSPYKDEAEGGKFPVYAVKIESKGHSLTNLMYGKDGRMYLAKDGRVYIGRTT